MDKYSNDTFYEKNKDALACRGHFFVITSDWNKWVVEALVLTPITLVSGKYLGTITYRCIGTEESLKFDWRIGTLENMIFRLNKLHDSWAGRTHPSENVVIHQITYYIQVGEFAFRDIFFVLAETFDEASDWAKKELTQYFGPNTVMNIGKAFAYDSAAEQQSASIENVRSIGSLQMPYTRNKEHYYVKLTPKI